MFGHVVSDQLRSYGSIVECNLECCTAQCCQNARLMAHRVAHHRDGLHGNLAVDALRLHRDLGCRRQGCQHAMLFGAVGRSSHERQIRASDSKITAAGAPRRLVVEGSGFRHCQETTRSPQRGYEYESAFAVDNTVLLAFVGEDGDGRGRDASANRDGQSESRHAEDATEARATRSAWTQHRRKSEEAGERPRRLLPAAEPGTMPQGASLSLSSPMASRMWSTGSAQSARRSAKPTSRARFLETWLQKLSSQREKRLSRALPFNIRVRHTALALHSFQARSSSALSGTQARAAASLPPLRHERRRGSGRRLQLRTIFHTKLQDSGRVTPG